MFLTRIPFTPARKRELIFVYRGWMLFGWGLFPVTLTAVYAAVLYEIATEPQLFPRGVTIGGAVAIAILFVAMMGLFLAIGFFARAQIRGMQAGKVPWPYAPA